MTSPHSGRTATLQRVDQAILVQPACAAELGCLQTSNHVLANCGQGAHVLRRSASLFKTCRGAAGEAGRTPDLQSCGMTLAGMEPVVRHLLRERAYVIEGPAPVLELPTPDLDAVSRQGVADKPMLDVLRHHDRVLVRVGRMADPAWIIGQITLAYPETSMVIVAGRKQHVGTIADLIRTWLPDDVTRVVTDRIPSEPERIVVGTYQAVLGSCMDLGRRELLIAVDAAGMLGKHGIEVLNAVGDARLVGLLPDDRQLAPRDADQLRGVFGFEEIRVLQHGHHLLPVDVVFEKITGGPIIPEDADTTTVRRAGVWRNPVRNRRIASLVRSLVEGDVRTLQGRFRRMYEALGERRALRVAVLADNVEHGVTLARRLPGWPVITDSKVCVKGLPRKDRDLLDSVGTTSGIVGNGIYTVAAADQIDPREIDALIRADTGSGLPPIDEAKWLQDNLKKHRLLLLDFDDRRHNELGRSTRKRRRTYRDRGWYGQGADSVEERVRDFLASRPKG